jgi:hypothetical protein
MDFKKLGVTVCLMILFSVSLIALSPAHPNYPEVLSNTVYGEKTEEPINISERNLTFYVPDEYLKDYSEYNISIIGSNQHYTRPKASFYLEKTNERAKWRVKARESLETRENITNWHKINFRFNYSLRPTYNFTLRKNPYSKSVEAVEKNRDYPELLVDINPDEDYPGLLVEILMMLNLVDRPEDYTINFSIGYDGKIDRFDHGSHEYNSNLTTEIKEMCSKSDEADLLYECSAKEDKFPEKINLTIDLSLNSSSKRYKSIEFVK